MIREHDLVALTCDLPEEGLKSGDVGTVVHMHGDQAYEVEFVTWTGDTIAVVTVLREQARAVGESELHHTRPMEKRA